MKFEFSNRTRPYDPNKPINSVDWLKGLKEDLIFKYLDAKSIPLDLLCVNIQYDSNLGNIIRTANSFGIRKVNIFGRKKFDRRGCVGTEFFEYFNLVEFIEDLDNLYKNYDEIIALENNSNYKNKICELEKFIWDKNKKYLIIIGQESEGIPDYILDNCNKLITIPMFGYCRSLNVSVASGILMHVASSELRK